MGKQTQVVQINSNFTKGKKDLQNVFVDHAKAELYAEGTYIETAISVSEYVVDSLKTAVYLRINSGLVENQKDSKIPFIRIELAAKQGKSYKEAEHAYQARQSNRAGDKQGKNMRMVVSSINSSKARFIRVGQGSKIDNNDQEQVQIAV